jgi:hypothetical protein
LLIHRQNPVDGSHGDLPGTLFSDEVCDDWGDVIDQNADALFIWMKAVRLIEPWIPRHALEKKRVERHATGTGEIRENPIKRDAVFFAPIQRRSHPGQQQPRSTRLYFSDYLIQMGVDFKRLDSAQGIVRTQFEYDERRFIVGEGPVHTREGAGGGIARYSLIDDTNGLPLCPQPRFELGREGRVPRDPESGSETVAQDEDHYNVRGRGGFPQQRARHYPEHRADCEGAAPEESPTALRPGLPAPAFISHSPLPIPM